MPTAAGKRRIRVAVVIPTHWDYRMGGSQYQAKLLIEELHRSFGADITWFAARASENLQFDDHRVVSVGKANTLRRFGHFWDYFRLQRALREFAPDVIYQRVGCAYTGIATRYARRSGTPMIWHLASQADCSKAHDKRIHTPLAAIAVSALLFLYHLLTFCFTIDEHFP